MRRKKTRWKFKTVMLLLLGTAAWYGVPWTWNYVKKKMQPRVERVTSQEEAMTKMRDALKSWRMEDEDLKSYAHRFEQEISWMEDDRARYSARWLFALELDARGLCEQSQSLITKLLIERIAQAGQLDDNERRVLLANIVEWGDQFVKRGDSVHAGELYNVALQLEPQDEEYFKLLSKSIDLKQKGGDMPSLANLISKLHDGKLQKLIKSPNDIRKAADYLLLEDDILVKLGRPAGEGEKTAFNLLSASNLVSSPEMGRILLSRTRGDVDRVDSLSPEENVRLRDTLERILVCFRASGDNMVYSPEVMLAIARSWAASQDVYSTILWLNRAEGSAMALGVDTPRILQGRSLKESIRELRNWSRDQLQRASVMKNSLAEIKQTERLLAEKKWTEAREAANRILTSIKETAGDSGYDVLAGLMLARSYAGEENWQTAGNAYESLLRDWKQKTAENTDILSQNLDKAGYHDLYKTIHRELAGVYLKQDMTTRAGELLSEIGEELPRPAPAQRRSRRSR